MRIQADLRLPSLTASPACGQISIRKAPCHDPSGLLLLHLLTCSLTYFLLRLSQWNCARFWLRMPSAGQGTITNNMHVAVSEEGWRTTLGIAGTPSTTHSCCVPTAGPRRPDPGSHSSTHLRPPLSGPSPHP